MGMNQLPNKTVSNEHRRGPSWILDLGEGGRWNKQEIENRPSKSYQENQNVVTQNPKEERT